MRSHLARLAPEPVGGGAAKRLRRRRLRLLVAFQPRARAPQPLRSLSSALRSLFRFRSPSPLHSCPFGRILRARATECEQKIAPKAKEQLSAQLVFAACLVAASTATPLQADSKQRHNSFGHKPDEGRPALSTIANRKWAQIAHLYVRDAPHWLMGFAAPPRLGCGARAHSAAAGYSLLPLSD